MALMSLLNAIGSVLGFVSVCVLLASNGSNFIETIFIQQQVTARCLVPTPNQTVTI